MADNERRNCCRRRRRQKAVELMPDLSWRLGIMDIFSTIRCSVLMSTTTLPLPFVTFNIFGHSVQIIMRIMAHRCLLSTYVGPRVTKGLCRLEFHPHSHSPHRLTVLLQRHSRYSRYSYNGIPCIAFSRGTSDAEMFPLDKAHNSFQR